MTERYNPGKTVTFYEVNEMYEGPQEDELYLTPDDKVVFEYLNSRGPRAATLKAIGTELKMTSDRALAGVRHLLEYALIRRRYLESTMFD